LPQPPAVSLLSTPTFIKRGEFSKLSWTSQDASNNTDGFNYSINRAVKISCDCPHFFQTDKAAIVPTRSALKDNPNMANNKVVLDSLVEALKSRTDITISITGNTDPRGGDKVNEPLSKARALVIEKYLISRGIDKSRLNVKWVSDKNPLGHSDSDQDEDLDRRTGVRIETQSFGSLGN
jgi:hypothetical protein